MKLKNIFLISGALALLASCSDDITDPVLNLQQAATLHEIAPSQIVITKDNASQAFPEISWDKANYGKGAVVMYTVTLTNKTTGKSLVLGETGEGRLSLTNAEMNEVLAKLGAYPGQANEYTVSLKSQAFDAYTDEASNSVKFTASPYDPNTDNIDWPFAYVAVNYPDWDFTKAYLIGDPDGDGIYQGWVNFTDACSYAVIDGADLSKILAQGQQVDDSSKGFVEVVLSDGVITQSVPCNFWGLIGDATSGGWSDDTAMEYDETTRLWTVITSLTPNHFKFRANHDWTINYGSDGTADGLLASGADIAVPAESPYIVTMDLTHAGKYIYSLEETTIELSSAFLTLPGSYQGWSPEADNCYRVVSDARDFKYTGAYYFEADTEFKFYDAGAWIGINGAMTWNDTHTSVSFAIGDGDNIKVEESAFYKISVDTKKMVATMTKTCWEVIGDATPNGWDSGQPMTYDPATSTWSIDITLGDGEIKFRWDASWTINLGGELNALSQDGPNIKVSAGDYHIVLDAVNNTATITAK